MKTKDNLNGWWIVVFAIALGVIVLFPVQSFRMYKFSKREALKRASIIKYELLKESKGNWYAEAVKAKDTWGDFTLRCQKTMQNVSNLFKM